MPVRSSENLGHARADLAACRAALTHGSRTFLAASFLLPGEMRDAACALYAFCRECDDAIDLGQDSGEAQGLLLQRVAQIYGNAPLSSPIDRAFAHVVARYEIPRELPEALLDGFAWDATGRQYETEADLLAYASRVAGSVGVMMSLLMDRRAPRVLARAAELGMAMQLTNIARDVGEDARAGRLYLPRQWLREAGVDPDAWLAAPAFDEAIGGVVARVLAAADGLYERADHGIVELPAACRPGIRAARTLYAAIGGEVRRRGLDSISGRAVVPPLRKIALLGRMLVASSTDGRRFDVSPLAEARHLVDAVPPAEPQIDDSRVVWVIDLFERLERRDRLAASRSSSA